MPLEFDRDPAGWERLGAELSQENRPTDPAKPGDGHRLLGLSVGEATEQQVEGLGVGRAAGRRQLGFAEHLALLKDRIRVHGPDHPDTARSLKIVATRLAEAGLDEDAADTYEALAAVRGRHPRRRPRRDDGGLNAPRRQAARVPPKICQASADFAVRLSVM